MQPSENKVFIIILLSLLLLNKLNGAFRYYYDKQNHLLIGEFSILCL